MIAESLKSDLELIEEERGRKGMGGFLRSCYEALCKKTPPIKKTRTDPAAYDLVVIGAPMWAGNMASPVRSYLDQKEGFLPAVAFLCTSGGSDTAKMMQDMQEFCEQKAVALLGLIDKEVKAGTCAGKIEEFTGALRDWMGR